MKMKRIITGLLFLTLFCSLLCGSGFAENKFNENALSVSSRYQTDGDFWSIAADYIGVDFIKDHGKWIVNEVEDAAGARMLYSLTDLDIAEMYMSHICEKSSQKLQNGIE